MPFCQNCGKELEDGQKCPYCVDENSEGEVKTEFNQKPFGEAEKKYEFPVWVKIVLCIGMLVISWGSIIGTIVGAVLTTSKDDSWKYYGKIILKLALIMLAVKVAIVVLIFILSFAINTSFMTFSIMRSWV